MNYVLKLKGNYVRAKENVVFLKKCLEYCVSPYQIKSQVRKAKPKDPTRIERVFIRDELHKQRDYLDYNTELYHQKLRNVSKHPTFMD